MSSAGSASMVPQRLVRRPAWSVWSSEISDLHIGRRLSEMSIWILLTVVQDPIKLELGHQSLGVGLGFHHAELAFRSDLI